MSDPCLPHWKAHWRGSRSHRQLGISVTDASGNLRDSETVYWETIDALGKVSNETERDALAMRIFGNLPRNSIP